MEKKLRASAKRLGMGIHKTDDGYMLYDLLSNTVVAGGSSPEDSLSLEELAAELEERIRIE